MLLPCFAAGQARDDQERIQHFDMVKCSSRYLDVLLMLVSEYHFILLSSAWYAYRLVHQAGDIPPLLIPQKISRTQ